MPLQWREGAAGAARSIESDPIDLTPLISKPESFFAPCPRGLEAPLAAELTALGATFLAPTDGGVGFAGPLEIAYHANLESRLASRILWRVAHGRYRNEDELYQLAHRIDWGRHFLIAMRAGTTS